MKLCVHPASKTAAFTLAEVLAALAFMAIVLPVTVEGLRLASAAGQVGERRAAAGLVAERILNELVLTHGSSQTSGHTGLIQEEGRQYRWQAHWSTWPEDSMSQLTVQVIFAVRGQEYDVFLTTLLDTSATTGTAAASATATSSSTSTP